MSGVRVSPVCRELRTLGFRNLDRVDLVVPPEGVVIIGPNGAGKTNLLEALYYLEIFRSFRGASDAQLVTFGEPGFHIRGLFRRLPARDDAGRAETGAGGTDFEVTAAYRRKDGGKRVQVDGANADRLADAIGTVGMVLFSPGDMAIITGSPSERRRFLDITLSLNRPGYLRALQEYRRVHRQRNALLRERAAATAVAAWDEGLVTAGARIMRERAAWLRGYAALFSDAYEAIGGGAGAEDESGHKRMKTGAARMRYAPSVPLDARAKRADDPAARRDGPAGAADTMDGRTGTAGISDDGPAVAEIATAFRAALERTGETERKRGTTQAGPHRDDIQFVVARDGREIDLRSYGSAGQQRTATIALRLTEAETVRRARGRDPVVLLDDVFAELDRGRSRRLQMRLDAKVPGQVIITAPKVSDIEFRRGGLAHWRIRDGEVTT